MYVKNGLSDDVTIQVGGFHCLWRYLTVKGNLVSLLSTVNNPPHVKLNLHAFAVPCHKKIRSTPFLKQLKIYF